MVCKPLEEKRKQKHKKGLWSPGEDQSLKCHILKHGPGRWSSVPICASLERSGKSCRLRWINYLRPGLKRGKLTPQEQETILTLHGMLGNKWSQIAQHLPRRTDNEIKNYWHSHLKKKKVAKIEQTQPHTKPEIYASPNAGNTDSSISSHQSCTPNLSSEPFEHFPKVLFAEWLSMDPFQGQDRGNSSVSAVSKDGFHHHQNTYLQDSSLDGFRLNDSTDDFFNPQEDEFSVNGSVYIFEDMCSHFNINNGVMHI